MALSEFALIQRYFSDLTADSEAVLLGIGDDCALLEIAPNHVLASSTDTLLESVHFPTTASAFDIASRALAVNLSDVAAMGAQPLAFTLALTLPSLDEAWLADFSAGLAQSAQRYGVSLIGGDTTRGPLSITVNVMGQVVATDALRRDAAIVGQSIYVSGSLGDSAFALKQLLASGTNGDYFHKRFYAPEVDFHLAQALVGKAGAAIDISDGLIADLGHILEASGVKAVVDLPAIPLSSQLQEQGPRQQLLVDYALAGGEDFRLCFCMDEKYEQELVTQGHVFFKIGQIEEGSGLTLLDENGRIFDSELTGYQHF